MSRIQMELEESGSAISSPDNSSSFVSIGGGLTVEAADQTDGAVCMWMSNLIMGGNQSGFDGNEIRLRENASPATTLPNSEGRYEPPYTGTSDGMGFQYIRKYTCQSPPVNFFHQMRTNSAAVGRQCNVSRGMVKLIRLVGLTEDVDWFYSESSAELTALSDTAWVNGESITIGDGISDYAVWTHGILDMNSISNDIRHRIFDGTSGFMEFGMEASDTTDLWPLGTCMYFEAPPAGTVITSQWRAETSTSPSDVEFNTIFGLRLSAFEDHAGVHSTDVTVVTALDTDFNVDTLTHTADTGGGRWWLYHGAMIAKDGDTRKRMDSWLTNSENNDINNGNNDRTGCEAATDLMPMGVWGEAFEPDATDIDIELRTQEETSLGGTNPRIIESVIIGFTPHLKSLRGVQRVTEWEFSAHPEPTNTGASGLDDFSSEAIYSPAAGPTGNVTIGTGPNRLFLFTFCLEDGIVIDVTTFTIGGVAPTGKFEPNFTASGGQDLHTHFYWWDEAAIQSMSGLAIVWVDGSSWTADGDATHSWATFTNVDQNDPVPSADQNSVGTNNINPHSVATPCDFRKDWSVVLSTTHETSNSPDKMGGMAILFRTGAVGMTIMAEGNHPDANALMDTESVNDTIISSIRIKAAPIQPFYYTPRIENQNLRR